MDELKPVEMDVEAIVSKHRLVAFNDKGGATVGDAMEAAVHEALAIAGVRAVPPKSTSEEQAAPMLSAVELALQRAEMPAESEGVRH